MPNLPPPEAYRGKPARFHLKAGVRLARIHDARFVATAFNPTLADRHWGGGRFDATEDEPYSYLYAGADERCAVAEALLRELPILPSGSRSLSKKAVAGRKISWISTTENLTLVSLRSGQDLARLGQDSWLTKCEAKDYGFTRRWAHQIRAWAPWCQGFVWRSRLEEASLAYIFFEDRCPAPFEEHVDPVLTPPDGNRLDRDPGLSYLRKLLVRYNVALVA